jgi:hypothetical protein
MTLPMCLAPLSPELPDQCRKCLRPHTEKSSRDRDANNQLAGKARDELGFDPHASFDPRGPSALNAHDPMLELLMRFSQYGKSRLTIGASIIAARHRNVIVTSDIGTGRCVICIFPRPLRLTGIGKRGARSLVRGPTKLACTLASAVPLAMAAGFVKNFDEQPKWSL